MKNNQRKRSMSQRQRTQIIEDFSNEVIPQLSKSEKFSRQKKISIIKRNMKEKKINIPQETLIKILLPKY